MLYLRIRISFLLSKSFALFISYLFHPGLMPTYLLATLYFNSPYILGIDAYSYSSIFILLAFVFTYTFLFPVLVVFWLYKKNRIESLMLKKRSDRKLPYLFSILSAAVLIYFFTQKSTQLYSSAMILGYIVLVLVIIGILNFRWKVSAHSAGIAGVLGGIFMLRIRYDEAALDMPFFIALLIAGLVLSARLKLNAHDVKQTLIGFLVGFIISIFGSLFI